MRFELAIDAGKIGGFDWDVATRRLVWEIFGYDRETFDETLEAFAARVHPDDRARTLAALRVALDTCADFDVEFRIVLPTGETRWLKGRGRAVADSLGRATRLLGAGFDTTSQRHADARVARVLEAMKSAFFALDRQWRFTYVNAEAERVLQRTRDELVGGSIWDLFPAASGSAFEEQYRGAMTSGQERLFEAYYPAPLDAWFEVRAWPGPDGLSVYFLDITERRSAEDQARRGAARLAAIAEVAAAVSDGVGEAGGEEEALRRLARAVVPVLGD